MEHFHEGTFLCSNKYHTNHCCRCGLGTGASKIHKGDGCLVGITTNLRVLLQYCLSAPILSQISFETKELTGLTKQEKHHRDNTCTVSRQEQNIAQLKLVLFESSPFKLSEEMD